MLHRISRCRARTRRSTLACRYHVYVFYDIPCLVYAANRQLTADMSYASKPLHTQTGHRASLPGTEAPPASAPAIQVLRRSEGDPPALLQAKCGHVRVSPRFRSCIGGHIWLPRNVHQQWRSSAMGRVPPLAHLLVCAGHADDRSVGHSARMRAPSVLRFKDY